MARTMAVTLLRHGLTKENKEKKYVGWTDVPLSLKGKKMLNAHVSYPKADLFITSDLMRCTETLSILYRTESDYILNAAFREMHFGDWELKTYEQLKENARYIKWLSDHQLYSPPNGESYEEFTNRIIKGWHEAVQMMLENNKRRAVIMTHGGVIRLLLEKFAPEEKQFWDWQVSYGSGYTLITTEDRLRRGERCILLQEVPFKESGNGCNSGTV
jgi:alpha-ribazole phosphatase